MAQRLKKRTPTFLFGKGGGGLPPKIEDYANSESQRFVARKKNFWGLKKIIPKYFIRIFSQISEVNLFLKVFFYLIMPSRIVFKEKKNLEYSFLSLETSLLPKKGHFKYVCVCERMYCMRVHIKPCIYVKAIFYLYFWHYNDILIRSKIVI